jgi:hypothetical protein
MKKIALIIVLTMSMPVFAAGTSSSSTSDSYASSDGNSQTIIYNNPAIPTTTTQNVNYSGGTTSDVNTTVNGTTTQNIVQSGTTGQNVNYSGTQTIKNVPSVGGPALTSSNDTCMGSTSGGIGVAGFGFSLGSTWTDKNCKMLKNSRELWNMGMRAASMARMCMDSENREALELTGFTCPTKKEDK